MNNGKFCIVCGTDAMCWEYTGPWCVRCWPAKSVNSGGKFHPLPIPAEPVPLEYLLEAA